MIKDIKTMRNEKGFTLIELLVVIVILGILAAVVVFAVGGLSDKGEKSSCSIDTRTLRTSEEAYFAKYGRYAIKSVAVAGVDNGDGAGGGPDGDFNDPEDVAPVAATNYPETAWDETTAEGEAQLIAAKLLSTPGSEFHDIAAGTDGDPYDIVIQDADAAVKCGGAQGDKVDGDTIK